MNWHRNIISKAVIITKLFDNHLVESYSFIKS